MKNWLFLLSSSAAALSSAGVQAHGSAGVIVPASEVPAPADDAAAQRGDDVVVVGKSYGREVGKTVTPLKDTANTITLIDRDQIEAQNLFTLEDALTATNGITVTGIGSEDPSFISRGFAIDNYLIDGVPTRSFGFPGVVPDLFFYDRLEVLRGPAGLFTGSGNPAGSINLIRKRPLEATRVQATAGYGSFDNLRLEVDASTRLTDAVGVRAGAMAQDQDQFFDTAHRRRYGAFAVGDVAIGARTTLTGGVYYDRFQPAVQTGLPGYAGGADGSEGRLLDVRRSTYLGADWNRFDAESWTGFVELAHQVSDRWTLRATGLLANVDRLDKYSYIGNAAITPANAGLTSHIAFLGDNRQRTRSFDLNGVGSFPAFGRDQTLILGADYQALDYTSYFSRLSGYARINVFDPVYPAEPPLDPRVQLPAYPVQGTQGRCSAVPAECVTQVAGATRTYVEQYGLYGQLRLSPVERLTLVGGGRATWWSSDVDTLYRFTGAPTARTQYGYNGRFTPYGAVLFDVTRTLNLYASYADSFTPQAPPANRARPDGRAIEPLMGAQYEVGSKLSLMNDRLLLSIAGYQITQDNRLVNPPELPDVVLQTGRVRARGIEAEATGQILPGWRINGGYTYTHTEYLEDNEPQFEGIALIPIIPEHMVKFFTNYAPENGPLAGASIGGALTWFSSTYGGNPALYAANGTVRSVSTIVRQPDYAVVDLRAGYKLTEQLSLSLNVANVLDKSYYARISSTGRGNFYGSPRTVFGTIRYTFQ
ncbi:outer membrane receptor for ferric coprogen and ferric-rhodotorulic acid [Sphingomonas sp. BE138]|uniref:TonB-dependent siderophore receptor n=1 Tax=Sphingomonas sp. BE138 TaxID=2817845 RepID=UPI00286564FC|nr:TonB-dependent siderophore receptor [Sphingomonas sp. BE138]MDR6788546.1 outer membrane receptor for ferric coprogen and ferric-rhodotorulic acid [Sphingomonas sp. BE138]